jgi:hypothetical protein
MKKEEKTVHYSAFVDKPGKVFLEKEMNRFHYLGNFPIDKLILEPKQINYSDYWKMCQLADLKVVPTEPVIVPSSSPDTQSIDSD